MKRSTLLFGACAAAALVGLVQPPPAGAAKSLGDALQRGFTEENIGRAIGAVTGALVGSQVGGGRGRLVAVAVGTLAGYWIGGEVGRRLSQDDRAGIASTTQRALDTGEPQTWHNPDTGVQTRVSVEEAANGASRGSGLQPRLTQVPPLELVNAFFRADTNVNVRGGPGTDYVVLYRLTEGARVPVVGQVGGGDWYLIAPDGTGSGFVYAPLLSPWPEQPPTGNAIRTAMASGERPGIAALEQKRCSLIQQEVMLPDGTRSTHDFTACRQSDGTWVRV